MAHAPPNQITKAKYDTQVRPRRAPFPARDWRGKPLRGQCRFAGVVVIAITATTAATATPLLPPPPQVKKPIIVHRREKVFGERTVSALGKLAGVVLAVNESVVR